MNKHLAQIAEGPAPGPSPDALIDKRSGRPKVVSKKMRTAIALLLSGECRSLKAAAGHPRVQLSRERLSKAFREPHVAAFVREQTTRQLAAGTTIAAARMLELVNAKSEHVSLDAATRVLAIDGVMPPENRPNLNVNVGVGVSVGYVIDLSGGE